MAKKDIDFKKFMLEKGERVGLWVAGGLAVLLIGYFGVSGLTSRSADANAGDLTNESKAKADAIRNATPSDAERESFVKVDPRLMQHAAHPKKDPAEVRPVTDFFAGGAAGSGNRRNPTIFAPEEFAARAVPAQLVSYMFSNDRGKLWIATVRVADRKFEDPNKKRYEEFLKRLQKSGRRPGALPPGMLPPGGGGMFPPGGGGMTPPGGGGDVPGGGDIPGGGGVFPGGGTAKQEYKIESIPLDELSKLGAGQKLAETIVPRNLAVIVGSFPYKAQIEEFQKALRLTHAVQVLTQTVTDKDPKDSKKEVQKPGFAFLGLNVERRVVNRDGTRGEWQTLDFTSPTSAYVTLAVNSGRRFEPEPPKLQPVMVKGGLVMKRPLQYANSSTPYPNLEESLPKIAETLAAINDKKATAAVAPNPQFDPEKVDPFGGDDTPATGGGMVPPGGDAAGGGSGMPFPGMMLPPGFEQIQPGSEDKPGAMREWTPPEYCLVRFVDVALEPGKVYEYRMQVRMTNPNYRKTEKEGVPRRDFAKPAELTSEWVEVKDSKGNLIQVSVPEEVIYYAVDEKQLNPKDYKGMNYQTPLKPDQVAVQAHRWVGYFERGASNYQPVGDWLVAERLLVSRGEHLGQKVMTKVPVWAPEQNNFVLATRPNLRGKAAQLVELSFAAADGKSPLLVDFEGGPTAPLVHKRIVPRGEDKTAIVKVEEVPPPELLLLTPDGKLVVRKGEKDEADADRKKRLEEWEKRLDQIENGTKNTGPGGTPMNPFGPPGGGGT